MKRAVLILMIVVFALVTVIPAFAMEQDAQGVVVPQGIVAEFSRDVKAGVIIIDGIIVDYGRIIAIRKAGGEQEPY